MTRRCNKCGRHRQAKSFNKKKASKDGLQPLCRDCQHEHHGEWSRRADVVTKRRARVAARRNAIRAKIQDIKDRPCEDCGKRFPYYVMEFDHVRGEKVTEVSNMITSCASLESLMEEIAKCDVVCSNCHRERTHGQNNSVVG